MMISLMFPPSHFRVPAIIFYTCIWLPLLQLKRAILDGLSWQLAFGEVLPPMEEEECCYSSHKANLQGVSLASNDRLPVAAFHEVEADQDAKVDGLCSVCLGEFQREEEVIRLPSCGHVFHVRCIGGWLDRDRFTCPLCRSLIFGVHTCFCAKCGQLTTDILRSWQRSGH